MNIILQDPDTYFQIDVPKYYLELISTYNLSIIGIQNKLNPAYGLFPSVISCMIKKSWLPDDNFLINKLLIRNYWSLTIKSLQNNDNGIIANGKYLIQGPIKEEVDKFPHSDKNFDVGSNLWLWNQKKQGKWLSFQENGCNFTSNIEINIKKPIISPVFHIRGGTTINKNLSPNINKKEIINSYL